MKWLEDEQKYINYDVLGMEWREYLLFSFSFDRSQRYFMLNAQEVQVQVQVVFYL